MTSANQTTLALRHLSPDAVIRIRHGARVRDLRLAEYVERLLGLYDLCRQARHLGDPVARQMLVEAGLTPPEER